MNLKFLKRCVNPFPLYLTGGIELITRNKGRKMKNLVSFDQTIPKEGDSTEPINRMFGFTLGRHNKIYVGWRYLPILKRAEIYVVIDNGEKLEEHNFGSMFLDDSYFIELELNVWTQRIEASIRNVVNKDRDDADISIPYELPTSKFMLSRSLSPKLRRIYFDTFNFRIERV